jgi:hypothetical protein
VAAALTLSAAGASSALEHRDEADGWRITLPDDWVVTPPAAIAEVAADLGRRTGKPAQYSAGFHPGGQAPFAYPYLLVQVHRVARASLEDLRRQLAGPAARQAVQRDDRSLEALAKGTSLGLPSIDERREMVCMLVRSDVVNVGPIEAAVAVCPGRELAVQLNFYCLAADATRDLAIHERVLDSFRFDAGKGYAYGGPGPVLIGGAIGGALGLAALLLRRRRARP